VGEGEPDSHYKIVVAPVDPNREPNFNNQQSITTVEELNGVSCFELAEMPPTKKQIYCTRSFGEKATELEPILQATALYAVGCKKARILNRTAYCQSI
jgi:hypothetical protein